MEYPDRCIRGIPRSDCLLEGGPHPHASLRLYDFHQLSQEPPQWREESINWTVDEDAIGFTLRQTNVDGSLQFKVGIAILFHFELNKLKKRHEGLFDFKRKPVEGNKYHGNLLLKDGLRTERKNMIRSALAIMSEVILRENIQEKK